MNKLQNFLDFLKKNYLAIGILITLGSGIFKFGQFVDVQRRAARQSDFENYHELIERLVVDRKEIDGRPFIDVQIATAYELRNFPRYYPVTSLILERLRNRLKDVPGQQDLIAEAGRTIEFIR